MQCETVKIVSPMSDENPHGYIVINKSDLTEDHEVFDPDKIERKRLAAANATEAERVRLEQEALAEAQRVEAERVAAEQAEKDRVAAEQAERDAAAAAQARIDAVAADQAKAAGKQTKKTDK